MPVPALRYAVTFHRLSFGVLVAIASSVWLPACLSHGIGRALKSAYWEAAVDDVDGVYKQLGIAEGLDKESVMVILGRPGDIQRRGPPEVWQYCSTGWSADYFAAVFFTAGVVSGVQPYSVGAYEAGYVGSCAQGYRNLVP